MSIKSKCSRGCVRCYGFLIGPPDPVSNIRPVKSEQGGSNKAVRQWYVMPTASLQVVQQWHVGSTVSGVEEQDAYS